MAEATENGRRRLARNRLIHRFAWPAAVVAALVVLSFLVMPLPGSDATQVKTVSTPSATAQGLPVEAVVIEAGPAAREVTVVGNIQSNESVVVTAEIAGRVAEIGFNEGEKVAAGKVLLRLDSSVLRAERDRARANLDLSEANYRRAETLLKENAVSRRERDEAYARWKLDEANLRLAEAQLDKATIRAPFSGTIGLRRVSLGGYLKPGDSIAGLDQLDLVKIDFRLPEAYASQVRVGQPIRLKVDAVPGREFSGDVYAIDPQLDQSGRSVLARARVANAGGPLRSGMFARITLVLEERAAALMIPEEALIPRADGQSVYKVVDGKVEAALVETGLRQKGRVEITAGLQAGETVITAGHLKVRPGMPVTVLPPAPIASAKKGS